MNKYTRRVMGSLVIVLALAMMLVPGTAFAQDGGGPIPVSGQTLLLPEPASPPVFTPVGPNIIGQSSPIFFICPGTIDAVNPPCTFAANGFLGMITAKERVVRHLASPNKPPQFTFKATQFFDGAVFVNGQFYSGTFTQTMALTGELNQPPGVNCAVDFTNPFCGAKNFKGTWAIVGEGTGALQKLRGNGTLVWNGCAPDFSDVPACLPKYEGKIHFAGGLPTVTAASAASGAVAASAAASAAITPDRLFIPFVSQ